jgi:hypothetical protein
MKCNVGGGDRIFRFIAGLIIILLGVIYQSWWGLVGVIPLITAFIRFCPLYLPFGISTNKSDKPK